MAEIDEAIVTYLLAQTGLTNLIKRKIFPEEVPQKEKAFPAVTYIKISDVKEHLLTGQQNVENPIFQFTVFADTKAVARAVANQIKSALVDYSGTLSGIVVQYIQLLNELSGLDTTVDESMRIYTEDLEFKIFFERS